MKLEDPYFEILYFLSPKTFFYTTIQLGIDVG